MDHNKLEAMLAQIEKRTQEILSSPEKARASLMNAGITDKDGKLTAAYQTPEGAVPVCTKIIHR